MSERYSTIVILLLFPVMFSLSCATIRETAVPYISIEEELPRTVAILPFSDKISNPEAAESVRKVFSNFFSSLHYNDIEPFQVDKLTKKKGLYNKIVSGKKVSLEELGKLLGAEAVIFGEVTSFGKTFALFYSDFHAELNAKMVNCKTGNLIWQSKESVSERDISIPSSPIGVITSAIEKFVRIKLDKMADIKVTSMLCHKMVSTIPELPDVDELGSGITIFLHNGANRLFQPGEELRVFMAGEPGQIGTWDILPIKSELPLEEEEPGKYFGVYTVKPDDKLYDGHLIGYLQTESGVESRWEDVLGKVYMGRPTILPEEVFNDLVLSSNKSPYLVEEILSLSPQARLIIEPGTDIWLKGIGIIAMGGEIKAEGTEEMPIRFMNMGPEHRSGILIDKSERDNIFSYCEIYNNKIGITAVASVVNINNCLFYNNTKGMIFEKTIATIKNSVVRASKKVGISVKNGEIIMRNSTVSENESGGILLESTKPDITYNKIYNNGKWELKLELIDTQGTINVPHNWWGSDDIAKVKVVGPVSIEPILKKP